MHFSLTSDSHWESRISEVASALYRLNIKDFFSKEYYGESLLCIGINLNCNDPDYGHKQRIRFVKSSKTLYSDLMFDLDQFKNMTQSQRESIVAAKIVSELPMVISKYKFKDFKLSIFELDLIWFFKKIKWL